MSNLEIWLFSAPSGIQFSPTVCCILLGKLPILFRYTAALLHFTWRRCLFLLLLTLLSHFLRIQICTYVEMPVCNKMCDGEVRETTKPNDAQKQDNSTVSSVAFVVTAIATSGSVSVSKFWRLDKNKYECGGRELSVHFIHMPRPPPRRRQYDLHSLQRGKVFTFLWAMRWGPPHFLWPWISWPG